MLGARHDDDDIEHVIHSILLMRRYENSGRTTGKKLLNLKTSFYRLIRRNLLEYTLHIGKQN